MYEHKAVGPNLKSYFYYTNEVAEAKNSKKGVILIASGIEGTGKVYDEIGDYLDTKGYAMYSIDELGYGKTGKMVKENYKNWKGKDTYYAAYNIHALSIIAKRDHPNVPIVLLGNDFGGMLSLILIKEFPEVINRLVTIGYGMRTTADIKSFIGSYIKKIFLYDNGESKMGHFNKNKYLALRFESGNKYSWLSSDLKEVNKIVNAGFIDTVGTVGHYFNYYKAKIKTPWKLMNMKGFNKETPMLFVSGSEDLTTNKGKKTKELANFFKHKKFKNVNSLVLSGRHELLFEVNKYDVVDSILNWIETDAVDVCTGLNSKDRKAITYKDEAKVINTTIQEKIDSVETVGKSTVKEVQTEVKEEKKILDLQEAEDDLIIKTHKD